MILAALLLPHVAYSELSPAAQRVVIAHESLLKAPSDSDLQKAFLAAFPATFSEFLAVFMPPDFGQLYDGHEYIFSLSDIGKKLPQQTLEKILPIETDAKWDADAVNYLQDVTLQICIAQPKIFLLALFKLNQASQNGIVRFLADGIEGPSPEFEKLVVEVEEAGNASLASQMRVEAALSKKRADREHGR